MRLSCKTLIVTRFGVGHGPKQVHAFSCPTCGVPITCVMRLDQEKAGVAFDPPVNAVWTDEEAPFPAPVFVTFHPEILNHKSTFQQDGASPFVTAVWHFADYDEFRKHESAVIGVTSTTSYSAILAVPVLHVFGSTNTVMPVFGSIHRLEEQGCPIGGLKREGWDVDVLITIVINVALFVYAF